MILSNIFLAYLIINGIAFGTLAVVVWVNDRRGNPEPFKKDNVFPNIYSIPYDGELLTQGDGDVIVKFTLTDTGALDKPIEHVTTQTNKGSGEAITGIK